MGIESLDALITRRGTDEVDALLAAARDEANRILAAAARRIADRRAARSSTRTAELDAGSASQRAAARHAARASVSRARERCLERVFAAARTRLAAAAPTPAGAARIDADLRDALAYLPLGRATVYVAPAAAGVARGVVDQVRPDAHIEIDRTLATGARVADADGRLTIDISFERRLDAMRRALAIELLRRIGGESDHVG